MKLIDIHTHRPKGLKNVHEIYIHDFFNKNNHPLKDTCFGIHPWFINKYDINNTIRLIEDKIIENDYFALGEIGLDRSIETSLSQQIEVFEKQLQLAQDYQIDRIILHNVKASFDIIPILKNFKIKSKILLHDFNENQNVFDSFNKKFDTFFSTGHQLFRKTTIKNEIVKLPLNKLFLESDDQETCNLEYIYQQCSAILGFDYEHLKKIILDNFENFTS